MADGADRGCDRPLLPPPSDASAWYTMPPADPAIARSSSPTPCFSPASPPTPMLAPCWLRRRWPPLPPLPLVLLVLVLALLLWPDVEGPTAGGINDEPSDGASSSAPRSCVKRGRLRRGNDGPEALEGCCCSSASCMADQNRASSSSSSIAAAGGIVAW